MDGPLLNRWVGRLHHGTARCVIGGIPVSYEQDDAPSSETINANIQAFIAPEITLNYKTDYSYKGIVHIPITEDNQYDNKVVSMTMICDDRQENYWTIYRYMSTIQRGETAPNVYPQLNPLHRVYGNDGHYRNRRMWVPFIEIHVSDDSFQKFHTFRFERCWPTNISNINFKFDAPDPVTFNISWLFDSMKIIRHPYPEENTTPNCIVNK